MAESGKFVASSGVPLLSSLYGDLPPSKSAGDEGKDGTRPLEGAAATAWSSSRAKLFLPHTVRKRPPPQPTAAPSAAPIQKREEDAEPKPAASAFAAFADGSGANDPGGASPMEIEKAPQVSPPSPTPSPDAAAAPTATKREDHRVHEEYDPAKPNNYEAILRERKRRKKHDDMQRKMQKELDRQRRERERAGTAAHPNNVSGEEAWKRRAHLPTGAGEAEKEPEKKKDFAARLMEKMGWKEGQGLGRQKQGIVAPLVAKKVDKRSGVIVQGAAQPPEEAAKKKPRSTQPSRPATRILLLQNLVGAGEVDAELEQETAEEGAKYGSLVRCRVHEVSGLPDDQAVRIFLEYETKDNATKALQNFNGRFFGGRVVTAKFFEEARYSEGDLDPKAGE